MPSPSSAALHNHPNFLPCSVPAASDAYHLRSGCRLISRLVRLYTVAELDLGPFYRAYRSTAGAGPPTPGDDGGAGALRLRHRQRSSRRIERRCTEDIAYRVITANRAPDHATIARFRARHAEELAELFGQVLGLCAKAGLVSVGTIALDGTRIVANAADSANRATRSSRGDPRRGHGWTRPRTSSTEIAAATSCRRSSPTPPPAANACARQSAA